MKTPYEGEPVPDGEYHLGQLSKSGYGRVVKNINDPDYDLYEAMPVDMDDDTFAKLFSYVGNRGDESIHRFIAIVKNNVIIHVY
jgi:hypothetical protein